MSDPISRFNLGSRLDARGVPDNPWIAMMELDARMVIGGAARQIPIEFAMTESLMLQAAAVFDPPTILMTFGLADMMCRLAGAIVTAGVFVNFGTPEPKWAPTTENTAATVEGQLQSDRFIWSPAYVPWMADEERQIIFVYLLLSLSRFVVLHEVAHIGLAHGKPLGASQEALDAIVDGKNPMEGNRSTAVRSQAKEIAADSWAFNAFLDLQDAEFAVDEPDPMRRILASKLMGTPRLRLRWSLLTAFLVFQILDRHVWTIESARLASHPPAPFRVKNLYATALELRRPDLPYAEIEEEVGVAQTMGSAIRDVGLNRLSNLRGVNQVDGPEFDSMFFEIYEELPDWIVWGGKPKGSA